MRGSARCCRRPVVESGLAASHFVAHSSTWVRASSSGIFLGTVALGAHVKKNELLGTIAEPLGVARASEIRASAQLVLSSGAVILPMVLEGEALFHIASFEDVREVADQVEQFQSIHVEAIESDDAPSIV